MSVTHWTLSVHDNGCHLDVGLYFFIRFDFTDVEDKFDGVPDLPEIEEEEEETTTGEYNIPFVTSWL